MNGIWIRSQDRARLIFATRIHIGTSDDKFAVVNHVDEKNYDFLAGYATEKQAIDVLDEIHTRINAEPNAVYMMPKE
jgi:hypothetical protein